MKTTAKCSQLVLIASTFTFAPLCIGLASDTNANSSNLSAPVQAPATVVTPKPAAAISGDATSAAPFKLPYGVDDVLKLSRAQVSDTVILNYVQGSGTIYNLTPKDIVYLKDQGVSEQVLNAMLDQRKRVELAAQMSAPPAPTAAPTAPVDTSAAPSADTGMSPGYTDQNGTYAQAPLTPPASSVYVIPYTGASPAYYGPYGYYYPYYGYYGPSVSFAFGFGHGYYGHGYYGGHYGSHAYGGHGGSSAHGGHH